MKPSRRGQKVETLQKSIFYLWGQKSQYFEKITPPSKTVFYLLQDCYIHIHIHVHIHIHHVHIHTYTYAHTCTHIHIHIYIYMLPIHLQLLFIYVCTYVCRYVCVQILYRRDLTATHMATVNISGKPEGHGSSKDFSIIVNSPYRILAPSSV